MLFAPAGELLRESGQSVHDVCPSLSLYVPASQGTQLPPSRWVPAGHKTTYTNTHNLTSRNLLKSKSTADGRRRLRSIFTTKQNAASGLAKLIYVYHLFTKYEYTAKF